MGRRDELMAGKPLGWTPDSWAAEDAEAARTRIDQLMNAMRLSIGIIDTNLYHQREKVEDARAILLRALDKA